MDPVVTRLLTTPERSQRDQLLEGWLASPQTYPITGDDKTLLVAVRRGLVEAGNRVRGQRSGVTPAPAPAPVPTPCACAVHRKRICDRRPRRGPHGTQRVEGYPASR
jgi:hypothetical protein